MQTDHFRCFHRLRVRWAEVDMQKIAFNAHYLAWTDCAVAEYWRALAVPYEADLHKLGGDIYLRRASVDYHASARMDDWLDIGMRCAHIGTTSMRFVCGIFCGAHWLTGVELIYVFADPSTQTKRPIPAALRELIEHYEAGGDMVELRVGNWSTLAAAATALRMAVFVQEQGIDPALEIDGEDANALHAVAYNRLGTPIATGRLLQAASGEGSIGRMAVERAVRGQRWGRRVLDALTAVAHARGDIALRLHAQCSAQGFYRRAGFAVQGMPYEEAGIAHVTMTKALAPVYTDTA